MRMSYYNPHLSNLSTQNFVEPAQGSQFYSPQKGFTSPYMPNQYNHRIAPHSDIINRAQSRPLSHNNSSYQPIPVSSFLDHRDFAKSNLSPPFAAPIEGISTSQFRGQNENSYLPPPPISYPNDNYRMSGVQPFNKQELHQSPNFNRQGLESRYTPYSYSEGTYVHDPNRQFSQQSRPQQETIKFDIGGYQPSHVETIQSRIVREEPQHTEPMIPANPHSQYFRQSFGSQLNNIPPQFVMSGVGDSILSSQQMGDLPTQSIKRDQNFYHDSYITINGLGTYKKYQLRDRKNSQQNNDNKSQQRGSQSQNQLNSSSNGNNIQYNQFLKSLVDISKVEAEVENIKIQLFNQQDFHIPSFFQFYDKNQSGRVSIFEFLEGQRTLGTNLSKLQLSLIYTRIVSNPQIQMTYEDFEKVCLPLLKNDIGKSAMQRGVAGKNISERTIDLFRRLLNQIYDSEALIDSLRKRIFNTHTRIDQFYRELNNDRNGKITIGELEQGMQKYGESLSPTQVQALFYRICLNKSTQLTFETFERFCYGGEEGKQQFLTETNRLNTETSSYNQFKLSYTDKPKRKEFKIIIDKLIANTELEVDIQSIQKYLMSQRDLRMYNLYGMFRPDKNYVDIYQFTETLKNIFKIPLANYNDTNLLYRKIKSTPKTQSDVIDFNEFCSIFISRDEQPPRELFDKDRAGNIEFHSETQSSLQKLFKAQLNNEVIFNEVRLEIQTKFINMNELFDFFCQGKAFLERDDFDRVLKENGSPHPTRYHNLLFSRFDPKNEGITNFNSFCQTLKL